MSTSLLDAVRDVAAHAGRVALSHFGHGVDVERKSDGSPVTIADRAAEQAAREWIESRFPDDGVTGEELGSVRPDARRQWVLDPIDGTRSFVRGVPLWGTLVGVHEGPDVLAGAAFFPALDEMLVAERGAGAWWNGRRCRVSDIAAVSDALVLTTGTEFRRSPDRKAGWERLASDAGTARTWGDCYGYFLVATGRAEVMVDATLSDWDAVALLPAIVEAGGVFSDWSGREWAFGKSAVATNAALAESARALLGVPYEKQTK